MSCFCRCASEAVASRTEAPQQLVGTQAHRYPPAFPGSNQRSSGDAIMMDEKIKIAWGHGQVVRTTLAHRHNAITASHYCVRVVIVTSTVGTAAHGDNPLGLRHLIIHLPQGRRHLVCQRPSHDHDIRLAGRRPEDDAEAIQVVPVSTSANIIATHSSYQMCWILPPRCTRVHHLHGTACKTEGHGPDGTSAGPVDDSVHLRHDKLKGL